MPLEPLNCEGCSECCNHMTFMINVDNSQTLAQYLDFYKARGCELKILNGFGVAVTVNSPCPHLSDVGCSIYPERPNLCKAYDCRTDPFLHGGKYAQKEKNFSGD